MADLYGAETWSLKAGILNRIEAFEIWTLRRFLRVPWIAHAPNEEILRTAGYEREILNIIKNEKFPVLAISLEEANITFLHSSRSRKKATLLAKKHTKLV